MPPHATESFPTNTPLRTVPTDYFPAGSERWFRIPSGLDAGKTLFYSDHRPLERDDLPTVVFVHGNPECSYTYRHIRDGILARGVPCRLIAPDHIGFGLSDQATFEMVDMHHAANLAQLVTHLDLRHVTLVIHDWGGPIGIGAFLDDPDRVDRLMLMNTTIFPMPQDGLTYENFPIPWLPWCQTPKVIPDALWGGVAGYVVRNAEPQGTLQFLAGVGAFVVQEALGLLGRDPESPESVFAGQFRTRANARSSKRNVLQTPVWGHGYVYTDPQHGEQDSRDFYARMHELVPSRWGADGRSIPAAGYFGSWDACGKESVIRQWQDALPQLAAATHVFPDHGHFIEEFQGDAMAATIASWLGPPIGAKES